MCNIIVKKHKNSAWTTEKIKINIAEAGSHTERKRGIDYMQIDSTGQNSVLIGAVVETMHSTPPHTIPKSKKDMEKTIQHNRQPSVQEMSM